MPDDYRYRRDERRGIKRGGTPMKQQPKDHKITVRLNLDGEEYAKGIMLCPEVEAGHALSGPFYY